MVSNNFYFFKSVIPKETCQKIIEFGLEKMNNILNNGESVEAIVGGERDKSTYPTAIPKNDLTTQQLIQNKLSDNDVYVRDSQVCFLEEKWIYELVQTYILEANKLAGWNFDVDYSESPQFTSYKNTGFYSWHKDGDGDWNGAYKYYVYGLTEEKLRKDGNLPTTYTLNRNLIGKVRKLSFTLNLTDSDSYEGGNLMFDFGQHSGIQFYECKEIRNQGSIAVFPSFVHHCVSPVTKGTRYSLVNWMCGRPFK
jgi:PKHD-type hydroxylase